MERYAGRYLTFRGGELLWDTADMLAAQELERERTTDWRTRRSSPSAPSRRRQEIERLEIYAPGG